MRKRIHFGKRTINSGTRRVDVGYASETIGSATYRRRRNQGAVQEIRPVEKQRGTRVFRRQESRKIELSIIIMNRISPSGKAARAAADVRLFARFHEGMGRRARNPRAVAFDLCLSRETTGVSGDSLNPSRTNEYPFLTFNKGLCFFFHATIRLISLGSSNVPRPPRCGTAPRKHALLGDKDIIFDSFILIVALNKSSMRFCLHTQFIHGVITTCPSIPSTKRASSSGLSRNSSGRTPSRLHSSARDRDSEESTHRVIDGRTDRPSDRREKI